MSSPPTSEITKEFLEEITGCQVLNYTVESGSKPGDGYLSIMYAVKVDLIPKAKESNKEPVKETRHLFMKCFPLHPARQEYLMLSNVFYNELSFYRDWVKALHDFQLEVVGLSEDEVLTPAFPPYVGGKAIDYSKVDKDSEPKKIYSSFDNCIAMVNLKEAGYRLADKSGGLDMNHLTLAVTEIAKEHILGWAFRNKVEWNAIEKFPFLKNPMPEEDIVIWEKVLKSRVELAVKTFDTILGVGNHLSKSVKAFEPKIRSMMDFFSDQDEEFEKEAFNLHRSPPQDMVEACKNDEPWRLQTHGDIWSNNMLFKYDDFGKPERVFLLDLQVTRQGCPTSDLTYMIYTATNSKFRKAHLDSLLQLYCDKFTEYCHRLDSPLLPGFSFEEVKRRFHRVKFIGYMMALIFFPIMVLDSSSEMNMEQASDDLDLANMFIEGFEKNAFQSPVFREKLLDVTQELYDEGVI